MSNVAISTRLKVIWSINYFVNSSQPNKIQLWLQKRRRTVLIGWGVAVSLVICIGNIPGCLTITPIWIMTMYGYDYIVAVLLAVILGLIGYNSYFLFHQRTDRRRWVFLWFLTAIWMVSLFLTQIYALKSIGLTGSSFNLSLIAQHPGKVGWLITKDKYSESTPSPARLDPKSEYQIRGILLNKSDKIYYFAAFPHSPSTISNLYELPEDKVIRFETVLAFPSH